MACIFKKQYHDMRQITLRTLWYIVKLFRTLVVEELFFTPSRMYH